MQVVNCALPFTLANIFKQLFKISHTYLFAVLSDSKNSLSIEENIGLRILIC